ncbi:MAG: GlxA family transcriptional regulator [Pseudomonadota bacterium]
MSTETLPAPRRYGFLLVPNYTLMPYAVAIDALRAANRCAAKPHYQWRTFGLTSAAVVSSSGVTVQPDQAADQPFDVDVLLVCGGMEVQRQSTPAVLALLRRFAERKMILGGVCTGAYLLAKAGLLDGYRCTIHWENLAGLREEFPNLIASPKIFEIDRDRQSCAGGTSSFDMVLHDIRERHGAKLANEVSELLICERVRQDEDRQRMPLKHRIGSAQPKLTEAVSLMEANIEEPMTLSELSHHIGLSRRQLERLFKKYLDVVPTRYYLELRLERARQLLLQTSLPIVEVALACGFISAPHFSKCYRDVYGIPPRDERRRAAGLGAISLGKVDGNAG